MTNLHIPKRHIIRLEMQPHFPMEDLSSDNTEVLKYMLSNEAGLAAYTDQLKDHQRYIHFIANRALRMLGIRTQYTPAELYAFSHGFAGFETIGDLVHEPRAYSYEPAVSRVAQFFVDTRDLFEIELDREIYAPSQQAAAEDDGDNEVINWLEGGQFRMTLTPAMEDAFNGVPSMPAGGPVTHDRPDPEKAFTGRHSILPEHYPNTYDVVVSMGEVRGETMEQLQMRVAGAGLARTLQTLD